jgi:5-methylcytosine-specific restriction endonuclease McrA
MAWNRRDDKSADHPKILAIGAPEPYLLWNVAGVKCSEHGTNGVIEQHLLRLSGFLAYITAPAKLKKAARRLVEVGLWHDQDTLADCPRCLDVVGELPDGAFCFHDWGDCNPITTPQDDETTKFKRERARRLKDLVALKEQIRARDKGLCRYCGVRCTSSKDTRSAQGLVYDHVDPQEDNSLENVVTACRRCNGRKKDRTPDEAKMPLLPPPASGAATTAGPKPDHGRTTAETNAGPRPDQSRTTAGATPDHGRPSRDARDGPGRGRPWSDQGSGRGPAVVGPGSGPVGPGLVGLVRGEAGPAGDGTGLVGFGPGREPPPGGPAHPPPDGTRAAADVAEDPSS